MNTTSRFSGNRVAYRALQAWARSAISVVYRKVEVTGIKNVPRDRPVILAANHGNALADIAVIVATVPEFPHFLAAASWWKRAPARLLFRVGGVLPVYRMRDGGRANNHATFEACHTALSERFHLAIFPEGEMHTEPALLPLKTGAARIALGASVEAGVAAVAIVPVGLVYEDRGRFQSDAEVRFGVAIEMDDWAPTYAQDSAKAVRALTDALTDALADVTVNHGSEHERSVVARAVAIALADGEHTFAEHNALRRRIASRLASGGDDNAAEYDALVDAVERHEQDLTVLGLAGGHPLEASDSEERKRLLREALALAPLAAVGAATNGPMVLAVAVIATRVRDEMWQATTKGVAGTVLAPLVWALEYTLLARGLGRRNAALVVAVGAVSGRVTLRVVDRIKRLRALRQVERLIAAQPGALDDARRSRSAVRSALRTLDPT